MGAEKLVASVQQRKRISRLPRTVFSEVAPIAASTRERAQSGPWNIRQKQRTGALA